MCFIGMATGSEGAGGGREPLLAPGVWARGHPAGQGEEAMGLLRRLGPVRHANGFCSFWFCLEVQQGVSYGPGLLCSCRGSCWLEIRFWRSGPDQTACLALGCNCARKSFSIRVKWNAGQRLWGQKTKIAKLAWNSRSRVFPPFIKQSKRHFWLLVTLITQ